MALKQNLRKAWDVAVGNGRLKKRGLKEAPVPSKTHLGFMSGCAALGVIIVAPGVSLGALAFATAFGVTTGLVATRQVDSLIDAYRYDKAQAQLPPPADKKDDNAPDLKP